MAGIEAKESVVKSEDNTKKDQSSLDQTTPVIDYKNILKIRQDDLASRKIKREKKKSRGWHSTNQ